MTDIDGDGLNVLPITVQWKDQVRIVAGQLRHTWKDFEPTLIDYELHIAPDGSLKGDVRVHVNKNPDRLKEELKGKVAGKIGAVHAPVLEQERWQRGDQSLLSIVSRQASEIPQQSSASTRPAG